jgi:ribosomal protein S18 acetylase RimI-like enzyme
MPKLLAKQHWVLREFTVNLPRHKGLMPTRPRSYRQSSAPSAAPAARLRRATIADLDALVALENASFGGDQLSHRRLQHWITATNSVLLVAVASATLLGSALVLTRADSPAARLYSIAISKSARGQGLGSKLLRKAESFARAKGSTSMRLEVATNNTAAISLYQKLGYTVFGRKRAYYDDGQDALRMQKPL